MTTYTGFFVLVNTMDHGETPVNELVFSECCDDPRGQMQVSVRHNGHTPQDLLVNRTTRDSRLVTTLASVRFQRSEM